MQLKQQLVCELDLALLVVLLIAILFALAIVPEGEASFGGGASVIVVIKIAQPSINEAWRSSAVVVGAVAEILYIISCVAARRKGGQVDGFTECEGGFREALDTGEHLFLLEGCKRARFVQR